MPIKTKILSVLTIVIGLVFVALQQSMAQVNPHAKAGVKGGLNVSNLYTYDVSDENPRVGFHAGVYGQPLASEFCALQLELLYSTRGSTKRYTVPVDHTIQYDLEYIDLPVLAVFKVGKILEFHAGAYGSYLLGAKIRYHGDLADGIDEMDRDQLKSFDCGLVGGVGFNVGSFQAGIRYNYGFVKLANSDTADLMLGDSRNSLTQIYLAINLSRSENSQRGYSRKCMTPFL
jgi:Outer membrane protein beta-barrel domain